MGAPSVVAISRNRRPPSPLPPPCERVWTHTGLLAGGAGRWARCFHRCCGTTVWERWYRYDPDPDVDVPVVPLPQEETMTFRQLYEALQQFIAEHPDHEALDRQVVVRLGVANGDDDEDLHVGGLQSAVVDTGCTDTFALVLDADQEPEPDEVSAS